MSHDFILDTPKGLNSSDAKFHYVIFCRKCGYVCWHGNAGDVVRKEMQANIPKTCFDDTEQL